MTQSSVWVRETNLQVEDAAVCVCVCKRIPLFFMSQAFELKTLQCVCVCVCVCVAFVNLDT